LPKNRRPRCGCASAWASTLACRAPSNTMCS
jgi:hypothetical protein